MTALSRNPVSETMTRVSVGGLVVRVWREAPSLGAAAEVFAAGGDEEVRRAVLSWSRFDTPSVAYAIASRVGSLDRVSAVEVLSAATGDGILFYPDWR